MKNSQYGIDLNCDMGEGMQTDEAIMPFISSANIACGYHAGNEATINKTIDYCLQYKVAIGAHPGFNDKANFGRTEVILSEDELYRLLTTQVQLIKSIAEDKGGRLHHVKAHGALYNMAAKNEMYARILAQAVKDVDPSLLFYGLSNSIMLTAAEAISLTPVAEVFADRSYQPDGHLTPRSQPGALITDAEASIIQVLQLVKAGTVQSITGAVITLPADTICLHGDGTHTVTFAQRINARLKEEGIEVRCM